MPRYIDAFKLIEYANNTKDKTIDANDIARFPTIDAVPVKHGHWVDKGIVAIEFIRERHEYECSRCGQAVHLLENEKPYYCDNCGCKMDEVSE